LTNIVKFSDDAIFSATTNGTVISWNKGAEKTYGYASQDVVGQNVSLLAPEGRKDDLREIIAKIGSGHRIDHIETIQVKKEGVPIHVSLSVSPILNTTRAVVGVSGIARDITESKRAEEELRQTVEKLRKSFANTINIIALTMETRDPYTAGHQTRVSSLARSIGQEMNLSKDGVDNIRMAGSIHDIGKMSIPTEILTKPSGLMDVEMALIRVHPQSGYDIIQKAELPYPIAEIVLQHHERLDGSGYPRGLKGEEILREAKIIAVADVVEAIASHRPYRPAFGIGMALEEIEKNRGILYDGEAVNACAQLFRDNRFQFSSE
jgi:PAS domain S-box-containing protein